MIFLTLFDNSNGFVQNLGLKLYTYAGYKRNWNTEKLDLRLYISKNLFHWFWLNNSICHLKWFWLLPHLYCSSLWCTINNKLRVSANTSEYGNLLIIKYIAELRKHIDWKYFYKITKLWRSTIIDIHKDWKASRWKWINSLTSVLKNLRPNTYILKDITLELKVPLK